MFSGEGTEECNQKRPHSGVHRAQSQAAVHTLTAGFLLSFDVWDLAARHTNINFTMKLDELERVQRISLEQALMTPCITLKPLYARSSESILFWVNFFHVIQWFKDFQGTSSLRREKVKHATIVQKMMPKVECSWALRFWDMERWKLPSCPLQVSFYYLIDCLTSGVLSMTTSANVFLLTFSKMAEELTCLNC